MFLQAETFSNTHMFVQPDQSINPLFPTTKQKGRHYFKHQSQQNTEIKPKHSVTKPKAKIETGPRPGQPQIQKF